MRDQRIMLMTNPGQRGRPSLRYGGKSHNKEFVLEITRFLPLKRVQPIPPSRCPQQGDRIAKEAKSRVDCKHCRYDSPVDCKPQTNLRLVGYKLIRTYIHSELVCKLLANFSRVGCKLSRPHPSEFRPQPSRLKARATSAEGVAGSGDFT